MLSRSRIRKDARRWIAFRAPCSRALYIDSDVRLQHDLSDVFRILDRFDIALTHAHARERQDTRAVWREGFPDAFPQFNGGVILYRKTPEVLQLMKDWGEACAAAGFKKDQVTLRELVWRSSLQVYILPPEYNTRYKRHRDFWLTKEARPKIMHLREYNELAPSFVHTVRWKMKEFVEDVGCGLRVILCAAKRLLTWRPTATD